MFRRRKKRPTISAPTNFEHRVHTGFDSRNGSFVGLPSQWASLIGQTSQTSTDHLFDYETKTSDTYESSSRPAPLLDPSAFTPEQVLSLKQHSIVRAGTASIRSQLDLNRSHGSIASSHHDRKSSLLFDRSASVSQVNVPTTTTTGSSSLLSTSLRSLPCPSSRLLVQPLLEPVPANDLIGSNPTTSQSRSAPPTLPDQYFQLSAFQRHLYHQLSPPEQQRFAHLSLAQQQQTLASVAVRLQQQKLTPQQLIQQRLRQHQQVQYLQEKKRERDLQLLLQQKQRQQQQQVAQQSPRQHFAPSQVAQQQEHPSSHPPPSNGLDNSASNQRSAVTLTTDSTAHPPNEAAQLTTEFERNVFDDSTDTTAKPNAILTSPDSGLDQSLNSTDLDQTCRTTARQPSSSGAEMSQVTEFSPPSANGIHLPAVQFNDQQFDLVLRTHVDSLDPNGHFERQVKIGEGSTSLVVGALVSPLFQQWLSQSQQHSIADQTGKFGSAGPQSRSSFGQGQFGPFVRRPSLIVPPVVAIKRMNIERQQRKELLLNELLVMRLFQHANVVRLFTSYLVGNELWLVMELMDGGVLTDIVTRSRMNETQIATVSIQCLNALAFLHSNHIIHRDIKSDSILLSVEGRVRHLHHLSPIRSNSLFTFFFFSHSGQTVRFRILCTNLAASASKALARRNAILVRVT
jgi:hypothetical protein